MSDLIRREDIPYVDLNSDMPHSSVRVWVAFKEQVDVLPSADAVEVVRCRECKHRRGICSMRYIEMVGEDERIHDYSTDNGYCSWGDREDGEA